MPEFMLQQAAYASSPEQKIHYIDRGEGKNIVFFIHGFQQNARDCFGHYVDYFQHLGRVVALDLPGHGQSYKGEGGEFSHNVAFKACEQLFDIVSKEANNITIVGHSMGSFLALKLALIKRRKIDNVILIAPVADFTPHDKEIRKALKLPVWFLKSMSFFNAMFDQYPYGDRKQIYDPAVGHKIPSKWAHYKMKKHNLPMHATIGYMRSFIGVSLMPLVKNNHQPTLLVYGAEDRLTPAEFGSSLASLMPRAVLRIVQNGGHNVHLTRKAEVTSLIEAFLEENRKKSFGWRNLLSRTRGKRQA